jgi:hypothetical protein
MDCFDFKTGQGHTGYNLMSGLVLVRCFPAEPGCKSVKGIGEA